MFDRLCYALRRMIDHWVDSEKLSFLVGGDFLSDNDHRGCNVSYV